MRVRVMVWNVRGFRDGADRVAALVRAHEPDVLLLNETGARWRLRRFARSLGMHAEADPWSPFRRRVKDAVLLAPAWEVLERRSERFAASARWYPRGMLAVRAARGGTSLWSVVTHLGLRPLERLAHARRIVEVVDRMAPTVVLGGDLNERPDGKAVALLSGRLPDAWAAARSDGGATFPATVPEARIDYLFVDPAVRVERVAVPSDDLARTASDHRPVVADLDV